MKRPRLGWLGLIFGALFVLSVQNLDWWVQSRLMENSAHPQAKSLYDLF